MISPARKYRLASLLLLLAPVAALSAKQTGSAIEQFQSLQAKLHQSHTAKDWYSYLATANQQKDLLNQAPDSLLEVARADVLVGDLAGALGELDQFARMGQSRDLIATSSDFSILLKNANFARIQEAMKANASAVSIGSTAFQLSDPNLLAEDVDYDPNTMRFFITSVREKKIISTTASGAPSDFAKAPDDWPMLAIKADPVRGVLWATEVAMQGLTFAPAADWGRSAVLCYDLKSGKLLRRIEGPRGSALGDMTLTANGDVIVSDGDGGGVYRVSAKGDTSTGNTNTSERIDNGDFISPQTPAMHPDGKHIFISDYVRGIAVLEIATKQTHWLSMEGKFALNGIDGLYFDRGRLIAVQNGTSPERVVAFTFDPRLTAIKSETIIERSTATLGDPTHGVVVDHDFYYIANSGWDVIDDHGNLKPGAKPTAPRIMRAHLPGPET